MRFKTDENLPLEAATVLREASFDVETVWEEALSGAADEIVASRATGVTHPRYAGFGFRQHSGVPTRLLVIFPKRVVAGTNRLF